jgi:putative membrane protein
MPVDSAASSASTAPLEKMDRDFVMKATGGGMMEIELGNIAQQNAASQRVKDFGAMMVRDHGKVNDELTSFASRRNLTLNKDSLMNLHKSHIESLKKKTGVAFDKAYMSMMVSDHKKDVAEFEKASKMCKDQECLAWAGKTLPTLQMHLDSAQAINKSL